MNVLMTGATGFIGKRLAIRLLAGGHSVTALTRNTAKADSALPGVTFKSWEPGEALPAGLMDSMEAVVNLAGKSVNGRWTKLRARTMDEPAAGKE